MDFGRRGGERGCGSDIFTHWRAVPWKYGGGSGLIVCRRGIDGDDVYYERAHRCEELKDLR